MLQPHLHIEKVESYVLLPGDPGRIDKILKFLEEKAEVNTNREFRISRGKYLGTSLSMVSSGMGCPAAAIAIEELANAGAETIIRIGTCGGMLKEMAPGDLVIPSSAKCLDGTTKEYDSNADLALPDKKVFEALVQAAKKLNAKYFVGINRTHDAFYEPTENFVKLAGKGFISSEMECSAVFFISALRNLKAGAVLVVNTPEPPEEVAKDPNSIYKLVDEKKVSEGMEKAIRVSLEAVKMLEEK